MTLSLSLAFIPPTMSPDYKYNRLSTTSTTPPPLEDIEKENLEPVKRWVPRSQGQLRHWIAHAANLVIILGLLVLLVHSNDRSRIAALSWDMHNYYCNSHPNHYMQRTSH